MSGLKKREAAELQRCLELRFDQLRREVEEYRERASGKHEAAAVAAERDRADVAFATAAATVDRVQLTRDLKELRDIGAAQVRMQNGTYGECVDCGAGVGYQRLLA